MKLNKLPRNDQAESTATVLPCAASVNLAEGLEDEFGFFLGETSTSIDDGKFEHDVIFIIVLIGRVDNDPASKSVLVLGRMSNAFLLNAFAYLACPPDVSV